MMRRLGWPRFPLLLGVVLGDKLETYLRLSYGRFGFKWLTRPGVLVLIGLLVLSLFYPMLQDWRERKKQKTGAV
jgi:TctA family transporter